jgi:WD40 repeat protein
MAIIDTKREGSARSFVATRDGPTHLAIKGNLLARSTAYFKEIELFEISTGKLKKYLLGHQNHVTAIALAPNDTPRLASVGADGVLNIWDTNSGAIIHSIVPDLYQ